MPAGQHGPADPGLRGQQLPGPGEEEELRHGLRQSRQAGGQSGDSGNFLSGEVFLENLYIVNIVFGNVEKVFLRFL